MNILLTRKATVFFFFFLVTISSVFALISINIGEENTGGSINTSLFVPYTGATGTVNLNTQQLIAGTATIGSGDGTYGFDSITAGGRYLGYYDSGYGSQAGMVVGSAGDVFISSASDPNVFDQPLTMVGYPVTINGAGSSSWQLTDGQLFRTGGLDRMVILSNGNIGAGTIAPTAKLDVLANTQTITVDPPTYGAASQSSGSSFTADGSSFSFDVYSYKDYGTNRVFSATPMTIGFTDDGSYSGYFIYVDWEYIANADGYRIFIYDPQTPYYGDVYVDVSPAAATSFSYTGSITGYQSNPPSPLSPASVQGHGLKVTGDSNINGSFTTINSDATKTPIIMRNSNGDKIFEMLDGGELSYGGDALSGAFDPNWKMEDYRTIQFAKFINTNTGGRTIMGVGIDDGAGSGATFDLRAHGAGYSETLFSNSMTDATAMIAQGGLGFYIGNIENQPLVFGTNNAEQARITGSGAFGMGTNNPQAEIHAQRTGEQLRLSQSTTSYVTHNVSATTGIITYDAFGTTPSFAFRDNVTVNGTMNATCYRVNGTVGLSITMTIQKNLTATCTQTFTCGLLTATTC